MGAIYCITNIVSGKRYIGQTIHSIKTRWSYHLRATRNNSRCNLHCAIRKYGAAAFKIEQIAFAETLKDLNEKETYYIAKLGTLAPNGYNLTTGGEGYRVSNETRQKLSRAGLGRRHSEKTRCKMSSIARGKSPVSEETRQKMSASQWNRKKTCCKHGHPFNVVNTYIVPSTGKRKCLICCYLSHGQKLPPKLKEYVTNAST